MDTLFVTYCAVAAAAVAVLLGALAAAVLHDRRRRGRDAVLRSKYLHIVLLALASGQESVPRFPMLGRIGGRRILAETIAGLVSATYGLDPTPLRRIVARYGLDAWLLLRVRRTRGYRRARYLALLARLPSDCATAACVDRYTRSRNRHVRFQALMVQLAAEPSASLQRMAGYAHPFSACEVAEILTLLRRGILPIAYEPLIESPNRNLRMLGLGIVRQFGIGEAERHLLRMVATELAPELGREALYTLCSMRYPLARREVARRIAAMDRTERKALLRYMAQEGYSPAALRELFDEREYPYYESLVQSYKRCLVC